MTSYNITVNISSSLITLAIFYILKWNIGVNDIEIGLYTFVSLFFIFLIVAYISGIKFLPKKFSNFFYKLSFLLMLDGVMIFVVSLLVANLSFLISPDVNLGESNVFLSLYYVLFSIAIKLLAQKRFVAKVAKITLALAGLMFVGLYIPQPANSFQLYLPIFILSDILILIGTFLYYEFNSAVLESQEEPEFQGRGHYD